MDIKTIFEEQIYDMDILMQGSDKKLILQIIDEVLAREDLYETKRIEFIKKIVDFKERYHV